MKTERKITLEELNALRVGPSANDNVALPNGDVLDMSHLSFSAQEAKATAHVAATNGYALLTPAEAVEKHAKVRAAKAAAIKAAAEKAAKASE